MDGNSLKQKCGVARITGDRRDPTLKLHDEFVTIGVNGAQCLGSNRYKSDSPRQICIYLFIYLLIRHFLVPLTQWPVANFT